MNDQMQYKEELEREIAMLMASYLYLVNQECTQQYPASMNTTDL